MNGMQKHIVRLSFDQRDITILETFNLHVACMKAKEASAVNGDELYTVHVDYDWKSDCGAELINYMNGEVLNWDLTQSSKSAVIVSEGVE